MAQPTQTRRILIKVDTNDSKGLKDIADRMGLLNKNTKDLSGNLGFLTNAFRGWLGFLGVRELANLSDNMQNLFNRLKLVTGSTEEAEKALQGLYDISNRTNQSLSGVGEVYNRLALSLRGAKANTGELQALTETLINTFRISGATTAETTNTIIQLSQAFSSGELRGQELRSVMEQNATLAGLLRERFGQDIYKKAAEGAIKVTDVLKLLAANQEKIAADAKNLAPTFEQTLSKSMNTLSLSVQKLNEQFGLSSKFASVMEFAVTNLGTTLQLVSPIIIAWGVSYIPALIASIGKLKVAMVALAASNPVLLTLTGISVVAVAVYQNIDKISNAFKRLQAAVLDFQAAANSKFNTLNMFMASVFGGDAGKIKQLSDARVKALRAEADAIRKSLDTPVESKKSEKEDGGLPSLIDKLESMEKAGTKLQKIKDILGEINTAWLNGTISISEYNEKLISFELYKVNRQFKEGKMDIFAYHQQLRDLNIAELNRQLAAGTLNLQQFNAAVSVEKLKVLDEQMQAGKISLKEYNDELLKLEDKVRVGSAFYSGVSSYIESVGTLSQNIAKGIDQAFGHLEDNFLEFIKTGKFNFKNFATAIMDDLAKIIVRASIIRPLAQGIMNYAGAGAATTSTGQSYMDTSMYAAKGAAFSGGKVVPFAKGGIVDSPTAFSFNSGKKGIMGEAGTEAILPLGRGKNGDLGVQASITPVTVNIINQSNAEVEQRETTGPNGEKAIEVLIVNKVKEAISTGKFDSTFNNSYGFKRKGS